MQCGEGGLLAINNLIFKEEQKLYEKGTNRSAFWRGEVDKYNWVDIGSSFCLLKLAQPFYMPN